MDSSRERTGISPGLLTSLVGIAIFLFTAFVSVWRILIWQVLNPLAQANLNRLLSAVNAPDSGLDFNLTPAMPYMSQAIVVAVLLLLARRNTLVRRRDFWLWSLPLLVILLLSFGSQFWSLNAANTIKRSWFLLAVTMGGVFIGLEFGRAKIVWCFEALAAVFVVLSFVIVLKYPLQGIMTFDTPGAWRGLFNYKSFSGVIVAFASLMFLFRLANFKNERWSTRLYAGVFFLLSLYFLYRTRNASAQGTFIVAAGLLALGLLFIRWGHYFRRPHWWAIGLTGVALLIAIWIWKDALFGMLGRNASLTGRIPLWTALVPFFERRVFFGYGFGEVFWFSEYLQEFWAIAPWRAGIAHSGYIEAILDTGVVGFFFWIVFLVEVGFLALRSFASQRTLYSMIFLIWFVLVSLTNVTENLLGTYEAFNWLLLVVSFAFLVGEQLEEGKAAVDSTLQTAHAAAGGNPGRPSFIGIQALYPASRADLLGTASLRPCLPEARMPAAPRSRPITWRKNILHRSTSV